MATTLGIAKTGQLQQTSLCTAKLCNHYYMPLLVTFQHTRNQTSPDTPHMYPYNT